MADNLLDKASILLTPTAYNDGSMLSIKPENGDGDFTFSRSSAATRVNAQGLVENVQIISPELVSNGNFSQIGTEEVSNGNFSQEGSELVVNGDFATDSDWTFTSGWSIANGKASNDGTDGYLRQNFNTVNGKIYKVVFTVSDYVSGSVRPRLDTSVDGDYVSSNGTYTQYITSNGNTNFRLQADGFIGSIDNVSVKEVGQDWNLGSGWSIGDDKAVATDVNSAFLEQSNILTIGKSYKITYTILDYVSGNVRFRANLVNGTTNGGNGTYTDYIVSAGTKFSLQGLSNFNGSITNISVKEVGQDWTLGTGWSVDQANGQLVRESAVSGSYAQTSYDLGVIGNKYSISIDVAEVTSGVLYVYGGLGGTPAISITSSGVYTINHIWASDQPLGIFCNNSFVGKVNNISVKEITDDTDIPRINYEGFSYQDALGSELLTNGDFATNIDGWSGNTTRTWNDGTLVSVGVGAGNNTNIQSGSILTAGKTYRFTWEIVSTDANASFVYTSSEGQITNSYVGAGTFTEDVTIVSDSTYVDFRFTGANTTTVFNSVSVKEVLGQEVVPDSGCGSWLLEPQSTNLITYSEPTSSETTASNITYEDFSWHIGFTNCIRFGDNSVTRFRYFSATISNSTEYVISAFVIMDDLSEPVLGTSTSTGDFILRVGGQSATTGNLPNVNMGNNIYRVSSKITSTSSGGTTGLLKYAGQSNKGFRIVGFQLENQSYATSYIPTNGATSTRLQDIANNSGNSTLINSTEGVFYAEIAALENSGESIRAISLGVNGDTNQTITIRFRNQNNSIGLFMKPLSPNNLNLSTQAFNTLNFNKIALKYKSGEIALWINGTEVITSTNTLNIVGLNKLDFNAFGSNNFFGKTKAVAVYKEALTDEQLQSLTTT